MLRIAVLIACYNRKPKTIRTLHLLSVTQRLAPEYDIQVYLLDDASTDGTADDVRVRFPETRLVIGTGSLFWNRGMCAAYTAAALNGPWDAYLLLNDDLEFIPQVLTDFLSTFFKENIMQPTILAGAVNAPDGSLLYSGMKRRHRCRTSPVLVEPDAERLVSIDTMNGNMVAVPGSIMDRLGGLDPVYHHAFGDLDLGYRAAKLGSRIFLYPKPVGTTPRNPPLSDKLRTMTLRERLLFLFKPPHGLQQYMWFVWQHGCRILLPAYVIGVIWKRLHSVVSVR